MQAQTPEQNQSNAGTPAPQQEHATQLEVKGVVRIILTRNIGRRAFQANRVEEKDLLQPNWLQNQLLKVNWNRERLKRNLQRQWDAKAEKQYAKFVRLRGSNEFAQAVRNIPSYIDGNMFNWDIEEGPQRKHLGAEAYQLGVLSYYVYKNELMPIYKVDKSKLQPKMRFYGEAKRALANLELSDQVRQQHANSDNSSANPAAETAKVEQVVIRHFGLEQKLLEELNKWDTVKIMLSRYGMYQIVLEKEFRSWTSITEFLECTIAKSLTLNLSSITGLQRKKDAAAQNMLNSTVANVTKAHRDIDELQNMLRLIDVIEGSIDFATQWELVREIVTEFVRSFGGKLKFSQSENQGNKQGKTSDITFNEEVREAPTTGTTYNLRFRYVIFEIHEVRKRDYIAAGTDQRDPQSAQRTQDVQLAKEKEHLEANFLSLLEGVLISEDSEKPKVLAPFKHKLIERTMYGDVSTWEDEYCIFTSNNALIRYNELGSRTAKPATIHTPHQEPVKYPDYWAMITRGIAYIIELRLLAKLLQYETSDRLARISDKMHHIHVRVRKETRPLMKLMRDTAIYVSNASQLMARLRNAATPTTIGTADYAVSKYRALLRVLEMDRLIEQAANNIQLINNALNHNDDLQLQMDTVHVQLEVKRDSALTVLLTLVLTLVTVILVWLGLPVFIAELGKDEHATETLNKQLEFLKSLGGLEASVWLMNAMTWLAIALVPLSVVFIFYLLYQLAKILIQRRQSLEILEDRFSSDELD